MFIEIALFQIMWYATALLLRKSNEHFSERLLSFLGIHVALFEIIPPGIPLLLFAYSTLLFAPKMRTVCSKMFEMLKAPFSPRQVLAKVSFLRADFNFYNFADTSVGRLKFCDVTATL